MLVVCGRRFFLRSWSFAGSAMGLLGLGLLLMFGAKPSKSGFLCMLGGCGRIVVAAKMYMWGSPLPPT